MEMTAADTLFLQYGTVLSSTVTLCTVLSSQYYDRYKSTVCLATLESCYPYTSGDTTKTGTYQKTCKLELIDYLLCNGT